MPFKKGISGNPGKKIKKGQILNKTGQPKKTLRLINDDLKAQGFEPCKPAQIAEAFELLLSLPIQKVLLMTNDENQPIIIRIVGKQLLSGKGSDQIEKMLDRAHGKAIQKQELSGEIKVSSQIIKLRDGVEIEI